MNSFNNRVWWCDNCQVPVMHKKCLACGFDARDMSAPSLKPVYQEELDYIESLFNHEINLKKLELEIWVSVTNNIYYFNGKPWFQVQKYALDSDKPELKIINRFDGFEIKRTKTEFLSTFLKANGAYIRQLQYEAEDFIRNVSNKYKKRTNLVSFSGGKDSIVVSNLVMNTFGRSDILHAFSDTTIEAPDTYEFIRTFQTENPLTPVVICKSQLDFFETSQKIGVPSRIQRWCCTTHKTNPLSKLVRSINTRYGVLAFDGIRKLESNRRAKYERITTKHKIGGEILASPILEWTEFQVWAYLFYHKLTINMCYEKGFRRVGCLFCPFNSLWSERMISYHYPEYYDKWRKFLDLQAIETNHVNPDFFSKQGWRTRAGGKGLDNYKAEIESYPCSLSDDSFTYQLLDGDPENLGSFLRPFGIQKKLYQTKYSEAFIVFDNQSYEQLMSVEISYKENSARISYHVKKNKMMFKSRVEKQIKKFQCCIKCGACSAICPTKANKLYECSIDSEKCVSCLLCVKHKCPAVDSLKERRGYLKANG